MIEYGFSWLSIIKGLLFLQTFTHPFFLFGPMGTDPEMGPKNTEKRSDKLPKMGPKRVQNEDYDP